MRRHWVCLSILIVLAATLVAPSLALATTSFQIKDAHGRLCGGFTHPQGLLSISKVSDKSDARVGLLSVGGLVEDFATSAGK